MPGSSDWQNSLPDKFRGQLESVCFFFPLFYRILMRNNAFSSLERKSLPSTGDLHLTRSTPMQQFPEVTRPSAPVKMRKFHRSGAGGRSFANDQLIQSTIRFFSSYRRLSEGWTYVLGNFVQQPLPLDDQVELTVIRVNQTSPETITVRATPESA